MPLSTEDRADTGDSLGNNWEILAAMHGVTLED